MASMFTVSVLVPLAVVLHCVLYSTGVLPRHRPRRVDKRGANQRLVRKQDKSSVMKPVQGVRTLPPVPDSELTQDEYWRRHTETLM